MIRRPPRSTQSRSSAASDVYKRQYQRRVRAGLERLVTRMSAPSAARLDWAAKRNPPADAVRQLFDATLRRYRVEVLQTDYEEAAAEARREVTAEAIERMAALRRALDSAKADEPTGIRGAEDGDSI
eukprot:TRINITY_DN4608_c0_g1_i3.p2 TRINITY_DN4608_c0_g1~~TRINITY_DN4608_c0_g1_i3.p2  ORF type:complete len:127 (+),score=34.43 TRINITY_DN4608_c0_g1_i3:54-434(+)